MCAVFLDHSGHCCKAHKRRNKQKEHGKNHCYLVDTLRIAGIFGISGVVVTIKNIPFGFARVRYFPLCVGYFLLSLGDFGFKISQTLFIILFAVRKLKLRVIKFSKSVLILLYAVLILPLFFFKLRNTVKIFLISLRKFGKSALIFRKTRVILQNAVIKLFLRGGKL